MKYMCSCCSFCCCGVLLFVFFAEHLLWKKEKGGNYLHGGERVGREVSTKERKKNQLASHANEKKKDFGEKRNNNLNTQKQ